MMNSFQNKLKEQQSPELDDEPPRVSGGSGGRRRGRRGRGRNVDPPPPEEEPSEAAKILEAITGVIKIMEDKQAKLQFLSNILTGPHNVET